MIGKIRFDTRGGVNPAVWKIFLGKHDISHLVAGFSITAVPNMPLPVVNLTLIGALEMPSDLVAILQATQLPAEETAVLDGTLPSDETNTAVLDGSEPPA